MNFDLFYVAQILEKFAAADTRPSVLDSLTSEQLDQVLALLPADSLAKHKLVDGHWVPTPGEEGGGGGRGVGLSDLQSGISKPAGFTPSETQATAGRIPAGSQVQIRTSERSIVGTAHPTKKTYRNNFGATKEVEILEIRDRQERVIGQLAPRETPTSKNPVGEWSGWTWKRLVGFVPEDIKHVKITS